MGRCLFLSASCVWYYTEIFALLGLFCGFTHLFYRFRFLTRSNLKPELKEMVFSFKELNILHIKVYTASPQGKPIALLKAGSFSPNFWFVSLFLPTVVAVSTVLLFVYIQFQRKFLSPDLK
jgi:hypothetical protein